QARPRSQWDPEPRRADTPVVLPNAGTIETYKNRATNLADQARTLTRSLADKEKDYRRFIGPVETYQTRVKNALFSRDLFQLAQALEALVSDPGEKGNAEKPRMEDLWKHDEMKNLASEIREFRDTVLYGDPLVVSKRVGKGRVVAYLTTAGTSPRKGVA